MTSTPFPDWQPAPNIRDAPDLYELENEALDPDGVVLAQMRRSADWTGRTLVDLGCGTRFWLPGYAAEALRVVGVEPDPRLREAAVGRTGGNTNVEVLAGSAEQLPLGEFAEILRRASAGFASRDPAVIDEWWASRRATRHAVLSQWSCRSPADLRAVLGNEFRDGAADAWLAAHPDRAFITYGFVLYAVSAPRGVQRPAA